MVQGQLVTTTSCLKGEMPLKSGTKAPDFAVWQDFLRDVIPGCG
jgi:hypothetical protein